MANDRARGAGPLSGFAGHSRPGQAIASVAHRLESPSDLDSLIDRAKGAQIVLLGEASHGTEEFYAIRAELSRRLIAEHGFGMVALEADWPDALRVHRFVTGRADERNGKEALGDFRRFPAWMWRNTVFVEFVEWLREWNLRRSEAERAGIFGLDLYSMHASMAAVLEYLERVDREAADRARQRYSCFELFGEDPQVYGYATTHGQSSCEQAVVAQLTELRRGYAQLMERRGGPRAEEEFFYAEQNARLVADAERYYRSLFGGREESWNLRDLHMAETLGVLIRHYEASRGKIIVWAHNSHLGDARATEMNLRGEWNLGQIVRDRFGERVFGIGFCTYTGTVTAARDWGASTERRRVRPALRGSYEALFHGTGLPRFWLNLKARDSATELLYDTRLERAIGVIYRPETERWSHYFKARLPDQFEALIHLDETRALEPLERSSEWDLGELPETYPEGL